MAKTFLISGGNSGIGLETVKNLSKAGHTLHCVGRSHEQIDAISGVSFETFDATDSSIIPNALPEAIDGLVYCPGTINLKPFHRLTEEDFLNDLQVNLMGAIRLINKALPALKKSESAAIVLFSTVAVQTGMPFHASIAASKGAIEGLTRSLAAELSPGIRVNCIAPSLTNTPLAGNLVSTPEKLEASANRHPLKRIGDPTEVAALVEFLLGINSGFITGQILQVDGGMSSLKLF